MTTPNRTPRGPIPPSRPRTDQPTPAGDGKALADAIASKITAGIMPALNLERQTMTDQTDNSGYSDGGPIPLRPKSISTEATAVREASIAQARAEGRADALQAIRTDDQFAQQGLVDRLVDMSREHGAEVHELQLAVLAGNTTTQQLQQLLDSATRRADELAQQLDATGQVEQHIEAAAELLGVTLYEAVPTEIEGLQRNLADERRRVEQLTEANRALRIAVESGRSSESAVGLFQLNEGSWGTAAASGSEQAPTPAERAHEAIGRVMAIANDLTDTGTGIEDDDTSTDSQRQVANRPLSE